ncbi:hypothetical protein [Endozoicomonas sp. ALD040]|uniref:hypothetical protein n=1 Tax=Endozoicomonas sp. ALD040 TaxID=3403079 RepID=UPI003BAF094A
MERYYNFKTETECLDGIHDIESTTKKSDMPPESKEWFDRLARPGYEWVCNNGLWPEEVPIDPAPAAERRQAATAAIDTAAGQARARFATDTPFIEPEYELSYSDAVAFIATGYTGQCPDTVKSHAEAFSVTNQQAADEIKRMGDQWNNVLRAVRKIRLTGKQAVETAADDADFNAVAQPFIDQLEALKP